MTCLILHSLLSYLVPSSKNPFPSKNNQAQAKSIGHQSPSASQQLAFHIVITLVVKRLNQMTYLILNSLLSYLIPCSKNPFPSKNNQAQANRIGHQRPSFNSTEEDEPAFRLPGFVQAPATDPFPYSLFPFLKSFSLFP